MTKIFYLFSFNLQGKHKGNHYKKRQSFDSSACCTWRFGTSSSFKTRFQTQQPPEIGQKLKSPGCLHLRSDANRLQFRRVFLLNSQGGASRSIMRRTRGPKKCLLAWSCCSSAPRSWSSSTFSVVRVIHHHHDHQTRNLTKYEQYSVKTMVTSYQ